MNTGPVRMCVACRRKRPQAALIRVVRSEAGEVRVEPGSGGPGRSGRSPGRGAYLCHEASCVRRAEKTGALARALRLGAAVPAPVLQSLIEITKEEGVATTDGETQGP